MADDVEARVRVAEEELNLLKNQVQQTLLDVREHILDLVEPGSGIPRGDRPAASSTETETTMGGAEVASAPMPPTDTGRTPMPDLGGGDLLGDMPGLDFGSGADMPGMDLGGDSGLGDMPGLDMGGDEVMGDMDPGPEMEFGFDDADGAGGGFDMEDAPFDGPETMPQGGYQEAPYEEPYATPRRRPDDRHGYEAPRTPPNPQHQDPQFDEPVETEFEPAAAAAPVAPVAPVALAGALAEMDLVTLVGVVRWVDQAVQRLGQRRVDALLDVWQMTGRVSEPTKEMIQRLCALTHEDEDERVPLRDLVAMMIQMEAVLDVEQSTNSRLLAMLFEDPGDPLAGLGSLARR